MWRELVNGREEARRIGPSPFEAVLRIFICCLCGVERSSVTVLESAMLDAETQGMCNNLGKLH
jgi:hypothetical protein